MSVKLPRDEKWKHLSDAAKVTYIEWACEVAEQETDGFFTPVSGKAPRCAKALVEAGLIVPAQRGGYFLPAFLKNNRSHEEMEADREKGRHRAKLSAERRTASAEANAQRTNGASAEAPSAEVEVEVEGEVEQPKAKNLERETALARRQRNPLFDALAESTGRDPSAMTTREARACGVALAEITRATPGLEPPEIWRRAGYYPQHFKAVLTPSALAAHWSLCDHAPRSSSAAGATLQLARKLEEAGQ